jgi:hypothetical protein
LEGHQGCVDLDEDGCPLPGVLTRGVARHKRGFTMLFVHAVCAPQAIPRIVEEET